MWNKENEEESQEKEEINSTRGRYFNVSVPYGFKDKEEQLL